MDYEEMMRKEYKDINWEEQVKNCRLKRKKCVVICNTFLHQAETAIAASNLAHFLGLKPASSFCGRFVWFKFDDKKTAKKFRKKWLKLIKKNMLNDLEEDVRF